MSHLLDTNVVSELLRPAPNPGVVAWWSALAPDDAHLSVVTLGEIAKGIELIRPRDSDRAGALELWLDGLTHAFSGRIVTIDVRIARLWGRLEAQHRIATSDALLASTAISRGWTLVTRNVRDFASTGCQLLDPFTTS